MARPGKRPQRRRRRRRPDTTKSYADLLRDARAEIREVTPREADGLRANPATTLVDVREASEWEQGHIPGARHVAKSHLEQEIEAAVPDRSTPVVLYCTAGVRSLFAGQALRAMGYDDVTSMSGGFEQWKSLGLPWSRPTGLSEEQARRYSRHLLIPEVGVEGQVRLLASKALIVGAGGLGSPAALYLAAAGVGTLGIVDFDVVDLSNLQRQVLHTNASVGKPKTASAAATIRALNPDVTVVEHNLRLDASNVLGVIQPYDVIVDGSDNFATKYLVNDAAVLTGKTLVYGSIFRFEGQASVFKPGSGPCYRCLFPEPTPSALAPSCDEAGVLGVLPGTIGLIQATETLKLLLGAGRSLVGRLLTYDALEATYREFHLRRDPGCAVCGAAPTIREVSDLEWSCHFEPSPTPVGA